MKKVKNPIIQKNEKRIFELEDNGTFRVAEGVTFQGLIHALVGALSVIYKGTGKTLKELEEDVLWHIIHLDENRNK